MWALGRVTQHVWDGAVSRDPLRGKYMDRLKVSLALAPLVQGELDGDLRNVAQQRRPEPAVQAQHARLSGDGACLPPSHAFAMRLQVTVCQSRRTSQGCMTQWRVVLLVSP